MTVPRLLKYVAFIASCIAMLFGMLGAGPASHESPLSNPSYLIALGGLITAIATQLAPLIKLILNTDALRKQIAENDERSKRQIEALTVENRRLSAEIMAASQRSTTASQQSNATSQDNGHKLDRLTAASPSNAALVIAVADTNVIVGNEPTSPTPSPITKPR